MKIDNVDIEAVFGCVPSRKVDSLAELAPLVGAEKAESIVRATGYPTRRVARDGQDVFDLMLPAARRAIDGVEAHRVGGIVSVSFSGRDRFPALSARLQHALGLGTDTIACDLSMACSGWIYGLLSAAQLVRLTGKRILLVDGDVQSAWIDGKDYATLAVMGDGATATLLAPGEGSWEFAFHTDGGGSDALVCRDSIRMDGFGVFRFVAGPVRRFLASFIAQSEILAGHRPVFVPHQANMYMVRQLAEALGLGDSLAGSGEKYANTGSCSASLALADWSAPALGRLPESCGRVLFAGFGAGLSAGAAATTLGDIRKGMVEV